MGARLGRYDILRTLTKGELTDLLLARADGMEGFQRHVAVKRLHASHARDAGCLEAFVNEARLAAALHHHNIVQVLDIGQEGGQPYFAMEYVHGVDLRTLLNRLSKRSEQLPLQHVVSIVAAVAAALHHAHEQRGPDGKPLGIVHRDVTPANILVGYDGNIKVVDFGIAKAAIKRIKTDQGVLKGRVPYMAPEQCAGKPIDRRSDVFALGIVTYELATVRRLFKGASEFLTMSAIVNGDIPKPSQYRRDVPPELEQIMMKALARDPAHRYQTAGEMALALDEVAIQVGVGASTTQLANYMKLQFGEQKEPWLVEFQSDEVTETTAVDFDGGASGLAPPPAEAVKNNAIPRAIAATRSSPIAQVRNIITPPKGAGEDVKKAVPIDKSYSVATEVEARSYDRLRRATTGSEHVPTEKIGRTHIASPPPPPPSHAGTPTDATEIVVPLPPMPLERPVIRRTESIMIRTSSRTRLIMVGAAFAVVVIVAGAIVLWPGSDVPVSAAPDRSEQLAQRMPEQKPEKPDEQRPEQAETQKAGRAEAQKPERAEAQKPEQADTQPSGLNATMADYDKAREEKAAAEKAAADQAAAKEAADKPATDKAKTAKEAADQAATDKAAAEAAKILDAQSAADAKKAAAEKRAEAKQAADDEKRAAAEEAAAEKKAAAAQLAADKQSAADKKKTAAAQLAADKKASAADKAADDKAEKAAADKAAADKAEKLAAAKTATTKRTPKPAIAKTVKRPAPKPAAKKSTKKGAKWNPDELFLGD